MPIDPNKLQALVEQQNKSPLYPVDGGGEPGEEDEEAAAPQKTGEQILQEMGEFGQELRENADILVPMAEEHAQSLVGEEVPPETKAAIQQMVDRMPDHIGEGLAEFFTDMPVEDAQKVAAILLTEVQSEMSAMGASDPQEATVLANFLKCAGACAAGPSAELPQPEEAATDPNAPPPAAPPKQPMHSGPMM